MPTRDIYVKIEAHKAHRPASKLLRHRYVHCQKSDACEVAGCHRKDSAGRYSCGKPIAAHREILEF